MKEFIIIFLLMFPCLVKSADIIVWRENKDYVMTDIFTVQKIFTRKITRWPSGQQIYVFTKPIKSIEHRDFVINTLQLTPYYFEQQLEEQTFAGRASSITEVPNDDLMRIKIENTPGAIGYLNYDIYVGTKKVVIVDLNSLK